MSLLVGSGGGNSDARSSGGCPGKMWQCWSGLWKFVMRLVVLWLVETISEVCLFGGLFFRDPS